MQPKKATSFPGEHNPKWLARRPLPILTSTPTSPASPLNLSALPLPRWGTDLPPVSARSLNWNSLESEDEDSPGVPSPGWRGNKIQSPLHASLRRAARQAQEASTFSEAEHQALQRLCHAMGYTALPGGDVPGADTSDSSISSAGSVASQVPLRDLQRRLGTPLRPQKAARPSEVVLGLFSCLIARLGHPPTLHSHLLAHAPRLLEADHVHLLLEEGNGMLRNVGTGKAQPAAGLFKYALRAGQALNLPAPGTAPPWPSLDQAADVGGVAALCVVPIPGQGLLAAVREDPTAMPFQDDEFELLRTLARLLAAAPPSRPTATPPTISPPPPKGGPSARFPPVPPEAVQRVLALPLDPDLPPTLRALHFDTLAYVAGPEGPELLARLFVTMVEERGLSAALRLDRTVLVRFLLRTMSLYNDLPYHNFFHAFDVAQMAHHLLDHTEAVLPLTPLEQFSWLVAALLHDVGHGGRTNAFLKRADAPLAQLAACAGTESVMELHHCQLALAILAEPDTNVFQSLPPPDAREAHRLVVALIMATDMGQHGEIHRQFRSGALPDRLTALRMLMKACDLSNAVRPFPVARRWGLAVLREFWLQGDLERAAGWDVSPMFDRRSADITQAQVGFLDVVAAPHFALLAAWCPSLRGLVHAIARNRAAWAANVDSLA